MGAFLPPMTQGIFDYHPFMNNFSYIKVNWLDNQ